MNNSRYGIMAIDDFALIFGSFDSRKKARWYGDSEFGQNNYRIVIL